MALSSSEDILENQMNIDADSWIAVKPLNIQNQTNSSNNISINTSNSNITSCAYSPNAISSSSSSQATVSNTSGSTSLNNDLIIIVSLSVENEKVGIHLNFFS